MRTIREFERTGGRFNFSVHPERGEGNSFDIEAFVGHADGDTEIQLISSAVYAGRLIFTIHTDTDHTSVDVEGAVDDHPGWRFSEPEASFPTELLARHLRTMRLLRPLFAAAEAGLWENAAWEALDQLIGIPSRFRHQVGLPTVDGAAVVAETLNLQRFVEAARYAGIPQKHIARALRAKRKQRWGGADPEASWETRWVETKRLYEHVAEQAARLNRYDIVQRARVVFETPDSNGLADLTTMVTIEDELRQERERIDAAREFDFDDLFHD